MKKFTKVLTILLVFVVMTCGLVACKEGACEHTYSDDLTCHNRVCTLCGEVQIATTSHTFNNQIIKDEYLFSTATCTQKARYHYVCDCGEIGARTFEYGNKPSHTYSATFSYDDNYHWQDATCDCGIGRLYSAHVVDMFGDCDVCDARFVSSQSTHGITYAIDMTSTGEKFACVTGYVGEDKDIVISDHYNGYTVKHIQPRAFQDKSIENVSIPNTISGIGFVAFSGCTSLQSVTFGENSKLESIGDSAFYSCDSLTSITIPDSVTSIGTQAFSNCTSLITVVISDCEAEIKCGMFIGCDALTSIEVDANNEKYKSQDGTLYTKDGKTLILYPSAKTESAFVVPDSVVTIGYEAFSWCDSIQSIVFGANSNLKNIEGRAFAGCTSLANVSLPDSLVMIENQAFAGTAYYDNEDNWEDGLLYIGDYLIRGLDKNVSWSLNIKDGTKVIADDAFAGCGCLKEVTIPNTVVSIGRWAFRGTSIYNNVVIPESVTWIGYSCFNSDVEITFNDTTEWYTTSNYADFLNKTGGTQVDITTYPIGDSFSYLYKI